MGLDFGKWLCLFNCVNISFDKKLWPQLSKLGVEAMQNNQVSFFMAWSLWDACSIYEGGYRGSQVGFVFMSRDCTKHVRVRTGLTTFRCSDRRWENSSHFSGSYGLYALYMISVWLMVCCAGPCYVSPSWVHCMLSEGGGGGLTCILANWFWPTEMSLSLTYGSPEVPCYKCKWTETYFGRRSASLMKEFWTLWSLLMTVSETVIVETISSLNTGLTHCL